MKRNEKGQVKFNFGRLRFVLTEKKGLQIYPAKMNMPYLIPEVCLVDEEFRELLAEAIEALDRPYGRINVIIPPHMKA